MENIGHFTLGNKTWTLHQVVNGQGNPERQELQLKFIVTGSNSLNFGFDFQHKVRNFCFLQ
jgi:hypothetical protein